jgi:predicted PurR-regulated permease PerM
MNFPPPTSRQAQVIWFAMTALAVALTLGIVGAVIWGVGRVLLVLSPVLWPLAVAAIIAMILDPVVEWLVGRKVPRLRAILLVFGVAAVLVLGVVGSIVPRVVVEARDLAGRIPGYASTAQTNLQKWINEPPASLIPLLPKSIQDRLPSRLRGELSAEGTNAAVAGGVAITPPPATPATVPVTNMGSLSPGGTNHAVASGDSGEVVAAAPWWAKAMNPEALKTAGDWIAAVVPEVGGWFMGQLGRVASWFGVVAGLALIPIYAFYFLLEKQGIETRWTDYLPVSDSRLKDEVVWLLKNINDALIVFFRGQVLVAICDGVLYAIGFLLIGLPYAMLLGMAAAVLTIVPFLGAIVTCGAALVIAMVQFGDWQHPLWVLAVFAIVQGIEGWVIQPKIIGDRVGLHPLTIIIALLVGTTLMGGILGGLLAIPTTAVIRALMFRYIWHAREARA